jgi:hypothetical protein
MLQREPRFRLKLRILVVNFLQNRKEWSDFKFTQMIFKWKLTQIHQIFKKNSTIWQISPIGFSGSQKIEKMLNAFHFHV